jgi:iron(III) transport system ATP-binding protein
MQAVTTTMTNQPALKLEKLSKRFGADYVVQGIDLEVRHGETVALLGPSGCGKSTTLRMVAGLERPSEGGITCEGRVISSAAEGVFLPPEQRQVGMVFQAYALWPHKTVFENVAYPLQLRRMSTAVVRKKVLEALALVGLAELESRPVPRLSGGQQQRVALARALVYEPSILLLDEPFSNLDTKLRTQLRLELKELQKKIRLTTLFVTHDQVEALSIADRVVIMNRGRIEEINTPRNVYENSSTRFVRDFLGKVVTLRAVVLAREPGAVRLGLGDQAGADRTQALVVPGGPEVVREGELVEVAARPEDVRVAASPAELPAHNVLEGRIETLLFVGSGFECKIRVGGQTVLLELPRSVAWAEGQSVYIHLPPQATRVWSLADADAADAVPARAGAKPAAAVAVAVA